MYRSRKWHFCIPERKPLIVIIWSYSARVKICITVLLPMMWCDAELTMRDLQALYNKAVQFTGQLSMTPCNWLYRNRWKKYFGEIMNKRGGVMEVYDKDNSGDQASPINSRLKGLFFMAKNVNGLPPRDSPFGEIRLQVPPEVLLNAEPNLYFTDFYCMRSSMHYVTLVMTRPDSAADRFCRNRLLPLDIDDYPNNPFLFRRRGKLYTANRKKLQIELLYTENIDINDLVQRCGATVKDVPVAKNCKGRSTPGGVPKNKTCPLCNLWPCIFAEFTNMLQTVAIETVFCLLFAIWYYVEQPLQLSVCQSAVVYIVRGKKWLFYIHKLVFVNSLAIVSSQDFFWVSARCLQGSPSAWSSCTYFCKNGGVYTQMYHYVTVNWSQYWG